MNRSHFLCPAVMLSRGVCILGRDIFRIKVLEHDSCKVVLLQPCFPLQIGPAPSGRPPGTNLVPKSLCWRLPQVGVRHPTPIDFQWELGTYLPFVSLKRSLYGFWSIPQVPTKLDTLPDNKEQETRTVHKDLATSPAPSHGAPLSAVY